MTRHRLILVLRVCVLLALAFLYSAEVFLLVPVALMMPAGLLTSCTIFTDDFSTDRTGTDYTIVSGTPTVSGGVLTTTSTGFLIVENTAGSTGHGHAKADIKVSASGNIIRVVGAYVDSSNYLYMEVTWGGGGSALKVFSRSGGVDTQIGVTANISLSTATFYTAHLCWDGTRADAEIEGKSGVTAAYLGTGNKAGFGTGSSIGTATFDNFSLSKHYSDDNTCAKCNTATCTACNAGTVPSAFAVTISGVVNGALAASFCASNCTGYNGTFLVPYDSVTLEPCTFSLAFDPCVSSKVLRVKIFASGTSFDVSWGFFEYQQGFTGPTIDCDTVSGVSVTSVTSSNDTICDRSAMTISITAVI
jgi:hypothetical protein